MVQNRDSMPEDDFLLIREKYVSPMSRRIEDWKSRLIDLSRRNNLLYFKPSKRGTLFISRPNMETIFNRLVLRKRKMAFWYPPEEDFQPPQQSEGISFVSEKNLLPTNQLMCEGVNRTDLKRVFKNLYRRSLLDYRERGIRVLHISFGMLVWKEKETSEEVHSPLLLVPIELRQESFRAPFFISVPPVEEEVILNPALQVKLKAVFKIELPPLPEYWEYQSLAQYFSAVTKLANEHGWRVEATVTIGLFSFHKLVIYNDLDANEAVIKRHPLIRAIAGIEKIPFLHSLPEEKDVDVIQPPEKTFYVLDADSSQRVAIEYALRGQSFVMQGPPGTGKSQTIANIIAGCIAHGKSVLFISDKMAALEVVYKRLREVGLSSFCLELHSSKANKQDVVAELKRCLDEQLVPRKLPSEHEFEKMAELRENLNSYVVSLHQKRAPLQKSVYEILGELSLLECVPFVQVELPNVESLTPQKMYELESLMQRLKNVWQVVEEPNFPWRGYRENNYNIAVRSELSTVLDNLISTVETLRIESEKFANQLDLKAPATLDDIKWLIEISNLLLESPKPEASWVLHPNLEQLISEAETHQSMANWRKATRNRLLERYNPTLFSLALSRSAEFEEALSAVNRLLLHSNIEESALLKKREKLLDFINQTTIISEKWKEKAQQLALMLGLPTENLTPDRIRQLSRIALICFSENKPEAQMLNPAHFQQVQEAFPKIKKTHEEYTALKLKLEKTYTDEIFKINLDGFIKRYNELYNSFLRWFRPCFYRDQKQLALLTRDGKVPKSVLQDLLNARRLKILQAEIATSTGAVQSLLGHFYQGFGTDLQRLEKAIDVASELFKMLAPASIPENLVRLVSYGSEPPIIIKQLGNELRDSFEKWDQLTIELSDLLPIACLPNSSLPLHETPITMLQEWASLVKKQLAVLCEMTEETLKTNKSEAPQNYKQLIADLKESENVRKNESALLAEETLLQEKFGFRFAGLETCWEEILSVLNWTRKIKAAFGSSPIPEHFADVVSRGAEYVLPNSELIRHYNALLKALAVMESRFETAPTYQGQRLQELGLETIQGKVRRLRERVDDLQVWVDFKEIRKIFTLEGLSAFFDRLVKTSPPASQLVDIFRKAVYQEWLNHLYGQDPHLGKFRRETHEQLIDEFRKFDQELIRLSANCVIAAANSRKPQDIIIQAEDSEVTTLLKEAVKKKRLMPIRDLLQKIPNLLLRLKPCLLMSPISVSQFLPAELMKFDVVIFDEASQIVPEDAIGAIYRGKTIVVAGDNKQLPPTSFFLKSMLEEIDWDEIKDEDVEVFDSILDECIGVGLPIKTLRWHYRSKHEELIAFSNQHFYNGTLITFPSAMVKHETLGLKLAYVPDGIYDRGGRRDNLKEAEVVANLVFDHFKKYPNKTLGVVTFSIAQMAAVEEAIEHRRKQQPEFEHFFKEDRLEGFFVKNLENAQGDERDVIILSLGYSYDPQRQITMNFGPINKAGGERRLNVAITRARERTILVTSIKSYDIDIKSTKAEGTILLQKYLEYAEKGPEALNLPKQKAGKFESPIEEDVAQVIQSLGYTVVPKVGYSSCPIDIGVVDPNSGNYILGIEFDGTTYASSNSARDRDRLREQVLSQMYWKIYRIWSPAWVERRDSEIKRLAAALEEARRFQIETAVLAPNLQPEEHINSSPPVADVQRVQFSGLDKIGVPYKVHALTAEFNPYLKVPSSRHGWVVQPNKFHFKENRQLQSRLLEELVREEGPIHFDYAVRRLASVWGLKRCGPKIVQAVKEALNLLLIDGKVIVKGYFLWPLNMHDVPVRIPVNGVPASKRVLDHIPPEEIENAMRLIAQYALGISVDSLIVETAKVFGFSHVKEKSRQRLSEIYKRLLLEKKLFCTNNVVKLPK